VGGVDEAYAIGMFEDDDLSRAVLKGGLRVCVAEDCFVHHFGQGSFGKLPSKEYDRIFETNRRSYEQKWQEPWQPHKLRPHARPLVEERGYDPRTFVKPEMCGQ